MVLILVGLTFSAWYQVLYKRMKMVNWTNIKQLENSIRDDRCLLTLPPTSICQSINLMDPVHLLFVILVFLSTARRFF